MDSKPGCPAGCRGEFYSALEKELLDPIAKRRRGNKDYFREESHQKGTKSVFRREIMRKEYDFSKMKGRKNPYAKRLKKQVTIRMGLDIIEYFKSMSEDTGIPYQNLINLYT
jgi:uncharacterized protein (DUF4415 family)